jgi:hypothetical protein
MFDITPFHRVSSELPRLIQPLVPAGISLKLEFGRLVVKKGAEFLEINLFHNLLRHEGVEHFAGEILASLMNLSLFVSNNTGSDWPKLGTESARFEVTIGQDEVIVALKTSGGKFQRIGTLTFRPNGSDSAHGHG